MGSVLTICSEAEEERKTVKPPKFKVIGYNGATVRDGEAIDSRFITKLPQGTIIIASEVRGRRVKVEKPVQGWASIKTESDSPPLFILEHIDSDE